jgi:acylphosphatase
LPAEGEMRADVVVRGDVQGVGFRYAVRSRAGSLGVGGWVRNELDGSVRAVFEGRRDAVESMVDWCRRGPSGARVDDVHVAWEDPHGERGFAVR